VISATRPLVIHHIRQANGLRLRRDIEGIEKEVLLQSVNVTLSLREIYEQVDFLAAS